MYIRTAAVCCGEGPTSVLVPTIPCFMSASPFCFQCPTSMLLLPHAFAVLIPLRPPPRWTLMPWTERRPGYWIWTRSIWSTKGWRLIPNTGRTPEARRSSHRPRRYQAPTPVRSATASPQQTPQQRIKIPNASQKFKLRTVVYSIWYRDLEYRENSQLI